MVEFKTLGDSGVIQTIGTRNQGHPHVLHHDRQVLDQRAKMVFQFLQSWGVAAALGDLMAEMHDCAEKPKRIPATDLAMRACEIVDAAWCELEHRGWIITNPPYEDCAP